MHGALKTKGIEIQDGDIEWVLTVPAIWNDPAKQFMRQAAEKVSCFKRLSRHEYLITHKCFILQIDKTNGHLENIPVYKIQASRVIMLTLHYMC